VRGLLAEAQQSLPIGEARREAELLLAHALQQPRAWLFAHAEETVALDVVTRFNALVARRAAGEPVAYLTRHREFWSLDLVLTPEVLIPRPDTELLVELALRHIPHSADMEVADLGTGSGAIALAIAWERPRARILASDASAAALTVAKANATRLDFHNIEFVHGVWFAALGKRRFDMIVSNPPYVAAGDPHLTQGDVRHEPRQALVSGADGLDAIRILVRDASKHLKRGGWLMLEHGHDQGDVVRKLLEKHGFVEIFTARDIERRERVTGGAIPGARTP
jgi:release factor glutamine methyltransferase